MTRLALAPKARDFLLELANFRDHEEALARLQSRYPDLFGAPTIRLARNWALHVEEGGYDPELTDDEVIRRYWLVPLRNTVRSIWTTDDVRAKRWGLFRILQDFFQYSDSRFDQSLYRTYFGFWRAQSLEPPTKVEQYLSYLTDGAPTRKCQNQGCAAPYFFAGRRTQRFCSDACAKPAQRAYKMNWWKRKGKQWRAERRANRLQLTAKRVNKRRHAGNSAKAKKSVRP
jgi:hypothetical protein